MHIHVRRKERFIADGSLSLAQFYYRNNVKAASFEAARSEIALTSKTAYFCSSCVPRVHVCVAHMEACMCPCGNIVGGCTLISTFHATCFLKAENAAMISRENLKFLFPININMIIYLVVTKLSCKLNSTLEDQRF
jgi:hypothetical protein